MTLEVDITVCNAVDPSRVSAGICPSAAELSIFVGPSSEKQHQYRGNHILKDTKGQQVCTDVLLFRLPLYIALAPTIDELTLAGLR